MLSGVRRKVARCDIDGFLVLMDSALEFYLGGRNVGTPDRSFFLRFSLWFFITSSLFSSLSFIERISFLRKGAVNPEHLVLFIGLNSLTLETSKNNIKPRKLTFSFC